MNNEKTTPVTSETAAVKAPIYKKRPMMILLSVLLAIAVLADAALITLLCVGCKKDEPTNGGGTSSGGGGIQQSTFDYAAADMNLYLPGFAASMVTGITVPGREHKVDAVTDENVEKYINSMLLFQLDQNEENYLYRVLSNKGKANKTEPMDYADTAFVYILYVEHNGEKLSIDYFNNAYAEHGEITIGGATFGEDFDSKLMGLVPRDAGTVEFITVGTVGATDIALVTYEATIDGEDKAYETLTLERWDMNTVDSVFRDAVVGKPIGQEFTFDALHDIDEDGEDEKVHYKATVGAVALEENVYVLSAELPDDYFGTSMDEEYTDLNGETLDFHIIIDYSVAYEISYEKDVKKTDENGKEITVKEKVFVETFDALTADYIKGTLGYDHGATGDTEEAKNASAREKYFAHMKTELASTREDTEKQTKISLIWQKLLEDLTFASLPEEEKALAAAEFLYEIESQYSYNASMYSDFTVYYPTIDDFARDYFGYDEEEYKSCEEYVNNYLAPQGVKQKLLIHQIYEKLGVKNDTEKYNSLRKELIDALIADAASQNATITEQEAVDWYAENYGTNYLHETVVTEMVNDYLIANNTVDFELSDEKAS